MLNLFVISRSTHEQGQEYFNFIIVFKLIQHKIWTLKTVPNNHSNQ